LKPRENKQREKYPAPDGRTYSPGSLRVKEKQPVNVPNISDLAHFWSIRAVLSGHETNGFPRRCPRGFRAGKGKNG
jgi:hypothetical protein